LQRGAEWNRSTWSSAPEFGKEIAMAIPTKDSLLVPYSTKFNDTLATNFATYHCTAAEAAQYTSLHTPYLEAYNALVEARAIGTRAESQTALKDATKQALLDFARQIYGKVAADMTISDSDKILLGVHVPVERTSIPRPNVAPAVYITGVNGRTVTGTLKDESVSPVRSKPPGSVSAWIYSFVGPDYPSDPSMWFFEGACAARQFSIVFKSTLPSGTRVWVCAAWINRKNEAGPISLPLPAILQGGGSEVEAA
jgi:hypothetical protein